MNEDFLEKKLKEREQANALRTLIINEDKIDFCSNDYLGIVKNKLIEECIDKSLSHGSTGSGCFQEIIHLLKKRKNLLQVFMMRKKG